jgi:hypothetical protein
MEIGLGHYSPSDLLYRLVLFIRDRELSSLVAAFTFLIHKTVQLSNHHHIRRTGLFFKG